VKLLQIEKPSLGYHILRESGKHIRTGRHINFHCLIKDTDVSHFIQHNGNEVLVYAAAAAANVSTLQFEISGIEEQLAQLDVTMTLRTKTSEDTERVVGIINQGKLRLGRQRLANITAHEIRCRDAEIVAIHTAHGKKLGREATSGKIEGSSMESDGEAINRGSNNIYVLLLFFLMCVCPFCYCKSSPVWEVRVTY
jgi:hypothetical protein